MLASCRGPKPLWRHPAHQGLYTCHRACALTRATGTSSNASTSQARLPYQLENPQECLASLVAVDNKASSTMTKLVVDVPDAPGLLRTITWVLNGMGVRVQFATLGTKDLIASDTFWLTTWAGKKLTEDQALLLKERVQDFVVSCQPRCAAPNEWVCHNLAVSNTEHPQWTVLTIRGEPKRQGFLLELASVISGTGAFVQEGYIQAGPVEAAGQGGTGAAPVAVAPKDYDFTRGRFFKFLLSDEAGNKLDAARIGALLFTYDVFTDARHMPLVAPNIESYLKTQVTGCL